MESILFTAVKDRKDLFRDLGTINVIDKETFEATLKKFAELEDVEQTIEVEDFLEIAEKGGVSVEDLTRAIAVTVFLFKNEDKHKDKIENVLKDYIKLEQLSEVELNQLSDKFNLARKIIPDFLAGSAREKTLLGSTFPVVEHMHTICVLVANVHPTFSGKKDDIDKYEPELKNYVPIVFCQMDIDKYGTTERFGFGLTELELERWIKILRAARKKLEIIKKSA